jgi:hypothetical protein
LQVPTPPHNPVPVQNFGILYHLLDLLESSSVLNK